MRRRRPARRRPAAPAHAARRTGAQGLPAAWASPCTTAPALSVSTQPCACGAKRKACTTPGGMTITAGPLQHAAHRPAATWAVPDCSHSTWCRPWCRWASISQRYAGCARRCSPGAACRRRVARLRHTGRRPGTLRRLGGSAEAHGAWPQRTPKVQVCGGFVQHMRPPAPTVRGIAQRPAVAPRTTRRQHHVQLRPLFAFGGCRPLPLLQDAARRTPLLLEQRGADVGAVALCRHRQRGPGLADLFVGQRQPDDRVAQPRRRHAGHHRPPAPRPPARPDPARLHEAQPGEPGRAHPRHRAPRPSAARPPRVRFQGLFVQVHGACADGRAGPAHGRRSHRRRRPRCATRPC
jgi:hypothetical protein